MAQPEQSRPGRTGRTDLDARARSTPESQSGPDHLGPEPEENQPGHHPAQEQDQPPLDDFAARLGIAPDRTDDGSADASSAEHGSTRAGDEEGGGEAGRRTGAGPDPHRSLPRPVRAVWVVTARWGVLPALSGVRGVTDLAERAVRRSIR